MAERNRWPREEYLDAVFRCPDLKPNERLVAQVFAFYAMDGTVAYAAPETIRQHTGIRSRDAMWRAIKGLVDAGWLVQVEKARQHYSPRYRIRIPPDARLIEIGQPSRPRDGHLGSSDVRETDTWASSDVRETDGWASQTSGKRHQTSGKRTRKTQKKTHKHQDPRARDVTALADGLADVWTFDTAKPPTGPRPGPPPATRLRPECANPECRDPIDRTAIDPHTTGPILCRACRERGVVVA